MQRNETWTSADARRAEERTERTRTRAEQEQRVAAAAARLSPVPPLTAPPASQPPQVVVNTPPPVFMPPRRRWAGLIGAGVIGAVAAALIVSGQYDDRTVGQRLDAGVEAAGAGVEAQVRGLQQDVGATVSDVAITASVKAALIADPALSGLAINVETTDGVVLLRGAAPDGAARERAGVLAAAPEGVRRVDNQLQVPGQASAPGGGG